MKEFKHIAQYLDQLENHIKKQRENLEQACLTLREVFHKAYKVIEKDNDLTADDFVTWILRNVDYTYGISMLELETKIYKAAKLPPGWEFTNCNVTTGVEYTHEDGTHVNFKYGQSVEYIENVMREKYAQS
jgi:hypothetical protein